MSENLVLCINAVLPTFLMILTGFAARYFGVIDRSDVPRINALAFNILLPLLLFDSIIHSDIALSVSPKLILTSVSFVLLSCMGSVFFSRFIADNNSTRGVVVLGTFRSNYVIIGLPLALSLCPDGNAGIIALLVAISSPLNNVLSVAILETLNGRKPDFRKILIGIATNPFIIVTAIGLIVSVSGIEIPRPLESTISSLASAASPLTLCLLGAFLEFNAVGKHVRQLFWVILGKLVIIPAIFLPLAALLGFRGMEFVALLGQFASPTAVVTFSMAQQMGGDARLAGDAVVFSSLLFCLTMLGWSFLFKTLGYF